jgi:hypothetical protein
LTSLPTPYCYLESPAVATASGELLHPRPREPGSNRQRHNPRRHPQGCRLGHEALLKIPVWNLHIQLPPSTESGLVGTLRPIQPPIPRERTSSTALDYWHVMTRHRYLTSLVVAARRQLTLPITIIGEMIPDIFGSKVPFSNLSLGSKVTKLQSTRPKWTTRVCHPCVETAR